MCGGMCGGCRGVCGGVWVGRCVEGGCRGVGVSCRAKVMLTSFQDPATKYHGHLLLAHIIAKFAIHKRIVLQV